LIFAPGGRTCTANSTREINVVISLADWQKSKAKTLLGEPVTSALKAHAAATAKLAQAKPISLEVLSAYLGANKSLQAAIQKAIGMCKPKLHDQTKQYLQNLETEVKGVYKEVQAVQVRFNQQLKTFHVKRAEAIDAIEGVLKASTPQAVQKAQTSVDDVLHFLNAALKTGYSSQEIVIGMKAITASSPAFKEILDLNAAAAQGSVGRPLPLNPAQLKGPLGDLQTLVKNLKTIGGFYPPKTAIDPLKAITL
jgi:hypothetical protein